MCCNFKQVCEPSPKRVTGGKELQQRCAFAAVCTCTASRSALPNQAEWMDPQPSATCNSNKRGLEDEWKHNTQITIHEGYLTQASKIIPTSGRRIHITSLNVFPFQTTQKETTKMLARGSYFLRYYFTTTV